MQGEGQEFESPRLHHGSQLEDKEAASYAPETQSEYRGQTPQLTRDASAAIDGGSAKIEPSFSVWTIAPLIRGLDPPTSGSLGKAAEPPAAERPEP